MGGNIIFNLLCLASFTEHNVWEFHPLRSMYGYFIPLYGSIVLCAYTTICLSTRLLIDIWAVFVSWQL